MPGNGIQVMPLRAGDRLGPYEIVSPLGSGGMGEVYRARDTRLGRDVALKVLPAEVAQDPARGQRFEHEARAASALNHPNIVSTYDVGAEGATAFIVSELVDGATLRESIRGGPVPVRKLLDIATQIADGMAAAHAAGILHRDLKPENIMLTSEGRVKILDFGLAKAIARGVGQDEETLTIGPTAPGKLLGTVNYMSPEQASGVSSLDGRSDQFSFGLILYELAAGKKAFERPTAAEIMTAIIRDELAPLPVTLPAPIRWTVERCLAKEPAQRYGSTRDLYLELLHMREHLPEAIAAPSTPIHRPRRRALVAMLAVGCFVAGLLAPVMLDPVSEPQPRYTPFATEPGIKTMPAWSPKGDRIAYSADVDGIFQIFTRKVGSSTPTRITRQNASCFHPFWNPDGTRIYYIVSGAGEDRSLWWIGVAGGQPEKVLDNVLFATLSPDGKTMALLAGEPASYRLMFSAPPGAPPKPYTLTPLSEVSNQHPTTFLQFTPDGNFLGFYTSARGIIEFWKIPLDGAPPRQLFQAEAAAISRPFFDWLPGGTRIVFSETGTGAGNLLQHDLRSGAVSQITSGMSQDAYPAVSPGGDTISFETGQSGYDLIQVPLDGSGAADVLATNRNEVAPSWSPDGVRFAYATDRSGAYEIWLRNRQDGSERLIAGQRDFGAAGASLLLDCVISPDGNRIAYRRHSGNGEIWISSLTGDAPVPLYHDPRNLPQRGPSWSPDGNWIAYYSTRDGKPAVFKARVGSGQPPDLVTMVAQVRPVRWSPRGDWIAVDDDRKLKLVSPDGKQHRVISQREWHTFGWSNEGMAIYGIAVAEKRRLLLGRIDAASGRETRVADLGPVPAALELGMYLGDFPYRGFSMHPDGKSFLTSVLRTKADIWLLQGFDRRPNLLARLWRRP